MTNEEQKEILNILMKNKFRMIKWIITTVVAIMVLIVIFYGGYSSAKKKQDAIIEEQKKQIEELSDQTAKYTEATKEVSLDVLETQLNNIGELATMEYLYTNAGKFEDPKKLLGIKVPFTTKSFIAKWEGCIKAGVKIDDVVLKIDKSNKEIIVHMPKAEILSHEIDSDSIETLDEKDGLFNPVKVEDVREFDKIGKEEMEKRAIENGILTKSYENAKQIVEKLLNNDIVQEQEYTIRFEEK